MDIVSCPNQVNEFSHDTGQGTLDSLLGQWLFIDNLVLLDLLLGVVFIIAIILICWFVSRIVFPEY